MEKPCLKPWRSNSFKNGRDEKSGLSPFTPDSSSESQSSRSLKKFRKKKSRLLSCNNFAGEKYETVMPRICVNGQDFSTSFEKMSSTERSKSNRSVSGSFLFHPKDGSLTPIGSNCDKKSLRDKGVSSDSNSIDGNSKDQIFFEGGGHDGKLRDEPSIRIQVRLHRPLQWHVSAFEDGYRKDSSVGSVTTERINGRASSKSSSLPTSNSAKKRRSTSRRKCTEITPSSLNSSQSDRRPLESNKMSPNNQKYSTHFDEDENYSKILPPFSSRVSESIQFYNGWKKRKKAISCPPTFQRTGNPFRDPVRDKKMKNSTLEKTAEEQNLDLACVQDYFPPQEDNESMDPQSFRQDTSNEVRAEFCLPLRRKSCQPGSEDNWCLLNNEEEETSDCCEKDWKNNPCCDSDLHSSFTIKIGGVKRGGSNSKYSTKQYNQTKVDSFRNFSDLTSNKIYNNNSNNNNNNNNNNTSSDTYNDNTKENKPCVLFLNDFSNNCSSTQAIQCKKTNHHHDHGESYDMTFNKLSLYPHNKSSSTSNFTNGKGMGANESRKAYNDKNNTENGGCLKGRSQSISALYGSNKFNGYDNQVLTQNDEGVGTNGLSMSIPADIWQLPSPNLQQRVREQETLGRVYNYEKSGKTSTCNKISLNTVPMIQNSTGNIQGTIDMGSRLNYSSSGGNIVKMKSHSKEASSSAGLMKQMRPGIGSGPNRSKLYAVSCPDVSQEEDHGPVVLGQIVIPPSQLVFCKDCGGFQNPNKIYKYKRSSSSGTSGRSGMMSGMKTPNSVSQRFPNGPGYRKGPYHPSVITQSHPHLYASAATAAAASAAANAAVGPPTQDYSFQSGVGLPYRSGPYSSSPGYYYQQFGQSTIQPAMSAMCLNEFQTYQQQRKEVVPNASGKIYSRGSETCHHIKGNIDFRSLPSFITQDNTLEVEIQKDHRGLGLSVTGGTDSEEKYPGLIRIKKVFPMGPAFQSGLVQPHDIILSANDAPLVGLTNPESLEVLRRTPRETRLMICRPPPGVPGFCEQALRSQNENEESSTSYFNPYVKSKSLSSLRIPPSTFTKESFNRQDSIGEFEIELEKINGSLGFTLKQEDTSILGHYVKELKKEPALSDGRIRPGDRILSVNGQDLSGLSHIQAINFLRQCPNKVTLRLFRDVPSSPISPMSPPESHKSLKVKPLRQEAIDMLNKYALKRAQTDSSNIDGGSSSKKSHPGSSLSGNLQNRSVSQDDSNDASTYPKRHYPPRAIVNPSPEVISAALDRFALEKNKTNKNQGANVPSATSLGNSPDRGILKKPSDSSSSNTSGGTYGYSPHRVLDRRMSPKSYPTEARSSGSGESTPANGTITSSKSTNGQNSLEPIASRPGLAQQRRILSQEIKDDNSNRKKPSYRQYMLHLDKISSLEDEESFTSDLSHHDSIASEPGFSSRHNSGDEGIPKVSNFKHGQPAYQSAILPSTTTAPVKIKGTKSKDDFGVRLSNDSYDEKSSEIYSPQLSLARKLEALDNASNSDSPSSSNNEKSGGLMKWKGVVFSGDDNCSDSGLIGDSKLYENSQDQTDESASMRLGVTKHLSQRRSPDGREFKEDYVGGEAVRSANDELIFTVQLSRRWCTRLGFSLTTDVEGNTVISAIYPDSLAAKDGRLRVGDEIIMVNGETIRDVATTEVIDLMRKTRGVIRITILRKKNSEPELDPNKHQLGIT